MLTMRIGSRYLNQECYDAIKNRFNISFLFLLEGNIDRFDDVIQIIHESTIRHLFNICTQLLEVLSQFGTLESRLSEPTAQVHALLPDPMLVNQWMLVYSWWSLSTKSIKKEEGEKKERKEKVGELMATCGRSSVAPPLVSPIFHHSCASLSVEFCHLSFIIHPLSELNTMVN